jgi:hypothetical protein
MSVNRHPLRAVVAVVIFTTAALPGCVKIETGSTREEAQASAELRAKRVRAEWANRVHTSSPAQIADVTAALIENIVESYVEYGYRVAGQWHEAIEGRGQDVAADEMRRMVGLWTRDEKPVLLANEDNIEYGAERLKETGYLTPGGVESLDSLVAAYYELYSVVFYPAGTVTEYESHLAEKGGEIRRLLGQFRSALDAY